MAGVVQESLCGMTFGTWVATTYLGRSKYTCICTKCGATQDIDGYSLKKEKPPKCKTCSNGGRGNDKIDLTGRRFGNWVVLGYSGNKKWKCQCSCGVIRDVAGGDLRNGKSTGCGHNTNRAFEDLKGLHFGEWEVLEYNKATFKWKCRCSCGTTRELSNYILKSGSSKSCGHATTGFKDLTGHHFGEWEVLGRDSINKLVTGKETYWRCRCSCGNVRSLSGYVLRNGISKSCGCKTEEVRKKTVQEKYGVNFVSQIGTDRTPEQLKMVESKEALLTAINDTFKEKPTTFDVAKLIGLDRASTMSFIHKYNLENDIVIGNQSVSRYENELNELFPCTSRSDRKVLDGKEIDLLYEDKRFAIEFNGNYWHSELKKEKLYHQLKTLSAAKKGIQLFHIFEYEWNNEDTKNKLIKILQSKLYDNRLKTIFARNCIVEQIGLNEANEFLNKYHLQGGTNAQICLGLKYTNELLGVMTFGKPRYNDECQYELIRFAWKAGIAVVGGSEKLFKHFINTYKPSNVLTYCDISKFTGNVYTKLGFKVIEITQPNYKWIDNISGKVLTRYQTQKQKLINSGYGSLGSTEAEIMQNLGFLRVYDCGNLKCIWTKESKTKGEGV